MDLLTDRTDYFMKWWDVVEPQLLETGHVRVTVRSDGHGVFVCNTLRRLGYEVRMIKDNWFPYNYVDIKNRAR